jgi:hypothetical protein
VLSDFERRVELFKENNKKSDERLIVVTYTGKNESLKQLQGVLERRAVDYKTL